MSKYKNRNENENNKSKWSSILAALMLLVVVFPAAGVGGTPVARAQSTRFFPETGHTVKGLFLNYWETHGGLTQQGFPITEELQEQSDTDGKTYTVQYFERAVFESHPEKQPPFNVLLSLLGVFYYNEKYGGNAPNQKASTTNSRKFTETGKTIGGSFRKYWETHGGLPQQGFPISDEFQEVSQTDGKTYTVQYFERAVFEFHPEFAGTQNEVLLSLLGVFFDAKRHGGTPQPTVRPQPTATSTVAATPTRTPTPGPSGFVGQIYGYSSAGTASNADLRIIDQSGRIFQQSSTGFDKQWTHVVAAGDGNVLFYSASIGEGRVGKVDLSGSATGFRSASYGRDWSLIAGVGSSTMVFFNSTTLQLATKAIKADGTPLDLKSTTLTAPWSQVVGMRNGTIFFYREEAGAMLGLTGRVDAQGNFTPMKFIQSVIPPGWTHITRIDDTHLLFYNSASGQYLIGTLTADGNLGGSQIRSMGAGWTGIGVPIGGGTSFIGALIAYRSDTGEAAIKSFDPSYNLTDLVVYSNETALPKNWNILIDIR
jgi:hypothetical protein